MRKVLIAVPCMDQLPAEFAHSLATLTSYGIEDTQISVHFNLGSLIYTSRDQIAKKAITDGADLVMWFDSDMVFSPDTLSRMLKLIDEGHDMVTGVYYRRRQPFTPVLFEGLELLDDTEGFAWKEFDTIPSEPFEVAACGFGCVLMRTEIFIAVFSKFERFFTPIANGGEDVAFCWRARQCGYKIIADPSISLGHVGHTIITREFFDSYQLQQEKQGRGE